MTRPSLSPSQTAVPESLPSPAPPAGKRERVTEKDPAAKLARHRLSVLQLAQELGSVAKACRQAGMDRTSFYEWKRRFQTHGLAGLKDLPPVAKTQPLATPPEVQERILALALQHPTRGCNFLSDQL